MNTLIDGAIHWVCQLILPLGWGLLLGQAVVQYKGIILTVLAVFVLVSCLVVIDLLPKPPTYQSSSFGLPGDLAGVIAPGFNNSSTPTGSPFGGLAMDHSKVTAYYKDLEYFRVFGRWHLGLDLIPNTQYYQEDAGYKIYGQPLIYATCSGIASSLRDSGGANYIYLVCDDKQYAVLLVHNKVNFIPLGNKEQVVAGQPLGVMGATGHADGPHVHYAVKDLKTQIYLDPLQFIN